MKKYQTIIIGSGCAAYSCALSLCKLGIKNIAIVTEGINCGTSRNTGSDKQTYYKQSMSTFGKDDAFSMAQSYYNGGSMHGDFALIEAAYSTKCFMRLVDLGVPFPTNEFGCFVGYQTDHDLTSRATSIGPLTSKVMTEKLENAVNMYGIDVLDGHLVIEILKNMDGVCGVIAINKTNLTDDFGLVALYADNVVIACGAPAGVYRDSVFPQSQNGATSLAIDLGLSMRNFSEWQYGIASKKFRWNLSGSYQQVLPRYVSVGKDGIEHEFLAEHYDDLSNMYDNIFLKGYQWPFDSNKLDSSSNIDMLIYDEIFVKSRNVYLDYTHNAKGYDFDNLSANIKDYIIKSQAVAPTPIERLRAMNPQAIQLYLQHGIDLADEYLEINIAAQHNNGGINTDINWQTDIDGLYVIGEAAGTFGIYRPGGSALNDTQVSAIRAAENIAAVLRQTSDEYSLSCLQKHKLFIEQSMSNQDNLLFIMQKIQNDMSKNAAFLRSKQGLGGNIKNFADIHNLTIDSVDKIPSLYKTISNLKSAIGLSQAILATMTATGSRGGAIFMDKDKIVCEKTEYRKMVAVTSNNNIIWESVRDIPQPNDWFEVVWQNYNNRRKL